MTKSEIFKKAHKIARETVEKVGNYMIAFSFALKGVYKMAKSVEEKLISLGMRVWEKGGMKRIYVNDENLADVFDLRLTRYKTGNISSAKLNGESISNSKAYKLTGQKTYFDVDKNKFVGPLAGHEVI